MMNGGDQNYIVIDKVAFELAMEIKSRLKDEREKFEELVNVFIDWKAKRFENIVPQFYFLYIIGKEIFI